MAVSRYVTHAFVLLVAVALTGYASIDRHLPGNLRLGAVNAQGLVMGEGGQAGGVSLGRLSTIIRPVAVPTSSPVSHAPTVYTVSAGEDLGVVATRFGLTVSAIRWSNFSSLKVVDPKLAAGDKLVIPPVEGLVVTVQEGDTAATLAATFHSDPQVIADYNYLRDLDHLTVGATLVIPGGHGPEFDKAAPLPEIAAAASANLTPLRATQVVTQPSSPGYTVNPGGPAPGSNSTAKFPYGYCTWYAASRHPVPFAGDAWQWFGNAQASGMATGGSPRPGAIMVTWESGWGHVAIVEAVHADGSWTVSEMNFAGYGVISSRTIRPGRVPLIGFIY